MKRFLKYTGYGFAALILLIVLVYGVFHIRTNMAINHVYKIEPTVFAIPTDSSAIAWGRHIAQTRGCMKCHGEKLAGRIEIDDAALGRVVTTNLTGGRGGVQQQRSDRDWIRAIRHGIGADGKPLLVMPSQDFYYMSDEDLGCLIAYLKQLPPVDSNLPALRVGPLARVLFQLGTLDVLVPASVIAHEAPRPDSPLAGVTPEYGHYLVQGNCQGCHGENLAGAPPLAPGFPPVPSLTKSGNLVRWTEADFIKTLRTGQTPEAKQLNTEFMPWRELGQMTDTEIQAVWSYLQTMNSNERAVQPQPQAL